ncbi:TRAP transporter large permease [Paracoccus jeotgali]|uniref:TRAP transporter large permease n=1 Tax=Paracoccus jeotgali TaxID=2065379 RepID=UPI0028ACDF0F|nr:TRAP transporter large permease [Paracoccus jeotgali]
MTLTLLLILLVALICVGAPIAFALIIVGTGGLFLQLGTMPTYGILMTSPYRSSASFLLTTIPMFILMAEFLASSSMARDIFRAGHVWLGRARGGMAIATTLASALLAALLGSSPAAAATMASIAVPEMRKYGYDDRLSLGIVASAGTLAVIIPPSVVLILYGILTENSIGRLFVAGLVPGIMTAVGYILLVNIWTRVNTSLAPQAEQQFTRAERIATLRPVLPALLLIVVVLGGIYSGFVTPSEAGALGAFGALVIGIAAGNLRGEGIVSALRRTSRTTAMIFAIVIAASIFGYYLTSTQVAQNTIVWVEESGFAPLTVLIALLAVYLLLGAFLDPVSILVLTLPLSYPLVTQLGYDGIWFGVIATKMIEIGLITPPVGINVFVTAGAVNASLRDAFLGAMRFLIVDVVVIILLIAFPELVTYLPNLLFS